MHATITKFSILAAASFAAAHGIVTDLNVAGTWWPASNPFKDPYMSPVPERIGWSFFGSSNSPVPDFTTSDITCNANASAAELFAPIEAGSDITFYWTTWPDSHKGPTMTYLANCHGNCSEVDPSDLSYFKINEAGYEDSEWASAKLIANNNSWTVTIPSDIAPGNYLIRHELLALHSAYSVLGAQFYPMCANLQITGSGTAEPSGVTFPGEYKTDDAGILINIYNSFSTYDIPGPTVYTAGGSTATATAASAVDASSTAAAAAASGTSSTVIDSAAAASTSEAAYSTSEFAAVTTAAGTASATSEVDAASATSEVDAASAAYGTTSESEESANSAAASLAGFSGASFSFPTDVADFSGFSGASFSFPTGAVDFSSSEVAYATSEGAYESADESVAASVTAISAGSTTLAAAAATGTKSLNASERINQCLDNINKEIASMQSKNGGAVDFSSCEAKRAACYSA